MGEYARTRREGGIKGRLTLPMLTATTIEKGALVAINSSGYALEAALAAGGSLRTMGCASHTNANAGASGAKDIEVEYGDFEFDIHGDDAVTIADVGTPVYVLNDTTIAKTDGGGAARIKAGVLVGIAVNGKAIVAVSPHIFGAL